MIIWDVNGCRPWVQWKNAEKTQAVTRDSRGRMACDAEIVRDAKGRVLVIHAGDVLFTIADNRAGGL